MSCHFFLTLKFLFYNSARGLMKSLYLVRHAKSSWDNPSLEDSKRPLNHRGKENAVLMGKILRKRNEIPDLIISSNAKRARNTARRFAKEIGYPIKDIIEDKKLYMADSIDFEKVISKVNDDIKALMLFSHNPGITNFLNSISGSDITNIPTSGICRIDFDIKSWNEINDSKGNLIYFDYPKKYV